MLDLRKPAGYFFALLGFILAAIGLLANFKAPLLDTNLNLSMGIFMLAFGAIFLWLSRKA